MLISQVLFYNSLKSNGQYAIDRNQPSYFNTPCPSRGEFFNTACQTQIFIVHCPLYIKIPINFFHDFS
jgi:hypothetical protein